MEEFGPRKCTIKQHPSEDRISLLPDEVLSCIISFLTLKEAGRTSVLSKRWIDVWTYVTELDFDASTTLSEIAASDTVYKISIYWERCKYVKWVHKVLQSHKALVLDKFRVYCDLNYYFQDQIDKWLQFAFDKRVRSLELNLKQHGPTGFPMPETYKFPTALVEHRGWKSLEKNLLGDFKSLKVLSLKRVNVSGEVLEFFLHTCKCLESLVVHGSDDLINMEVCGPFLALQHLEICLCYYLESLIVCNANLISLKIEQPESLVLKNVPVLVDLYIYGCSYIVDDVIDRLFWHSSKLEVLTLFFQPEKASEFETKLPQLSALKHLILVHCSPEGESMNGLSSFIRASPNLEKFVIKLLYPYLDFMKRSRKSEDVVNYPIPHLKEVEISGYCGGTIELELVKHFLANAVSLEKITVDPCYPSTFEEPMIDYRGRSNKVEMEHRGRRCANQQLMGLIPSHVTLHIL